MFYFIINVGWDIIKPLVKKTNKQKKHKIFQWNVYLPQKFLNQLQRL